MSTDQIQEKLNVGTVALWVDFEIIAVRDEVEQACLGQPAASIIVRDVNNPVRVEQPLSMHGGGKVSPVEVASDAHDDSCAFVNLVEVNNQGFGG
jgi:hypothetical protein